MSLSENTSRYREIFNSIKLSPYFRYTNKQISEWSGIETSKLSRFLTGKRDLNAREFFNLLESMPEAFQKQFWHSYNPIDCQIADSASIKSMDLTALGNLLQAIGAELDRRNN